jgi:nucleoside-diphosphate-sugar epimerase
MRVLVTGSSGLIGRTVIAALGKTYRFAGLDVAAPSGDLAVPTTVADVANLEAILPAFKGVDAVVHLAASVPFRSPWPEVLKNNVIGTHNVFEACRAQGVKRVVFASSNHAVGMYEQDSPYREIVAGRYEGLEPGGFAVLDHTVPVRPDGDYGVSKAFGEATGRYYSEAFGLEVACLRIGTVNRHDRPARSVRHFATWLSHRDLTQLVDRSLRRPLGFEVFYGVSRNRWRFWDISHAAETVGYDPQDDAEDWRSGTSSAPRQPRGG